MKLYTLNNFSSLHKAPEVVKTEETEYLRFRVRHVSPNIETITDVARENFGAIQYETVFFTSSVFLFQITYNKFILSRHNKLLGFNATSSTR